MSLGYAGGLVGPLMMGWTLGLSDGMSTMGWGLSFAAVAALMLLALIARPFGTKTADGRFFK